MRLPSRDRRWPFVGLIVVAGLLAGAVAVVAWRASAGDPVPPPDVVVVGDSLAEQSRDSLIAVGAVNGIKVDVSAYGGSAMCDWASRFDELVADPPPRLVLSFSGNSVTPCINPDLATLSADQIAALYRTALTDLLARFAGSSTIISVVVPPPDRDPGLEADAAAMRAMYRDVAASHPAVLVIDGGALLAPDGAYHDRLPCEAWDLCDADGSVTLRQSDGVHLTPAGGARYARAIIQAVIP